MIFKLFNTALSGTYLNETKGQKLLRQYPILKKYKVKIVDRKELREDSDRYYYDIPCEIEINTLEELMQFENDIRENTLDKDWGIIICKDKLYIYDDWAE